MAGSNFCVSCAHLPEKNRSAATRRQRCPECHAELGVTSYGTQFRLLPAKGRQGSPLLFRGMMLGAGLLAFGVLIIGIGVWLSDGGIRQARVPDPPPAQDLARVPEVALVDALPGHLTAQEAKGRLQQLVTRIRTENAVKQDGFLFAQIDRRQELRGLPFVMGDACRMNKDRAVSFQTSVQAVRNAQAVEARGSRFQTHAEEQDALFWNRYQTETAQQGTNTTAGVAALTQILAPERMSLRAGLLQRLTRSSLPEATWALARTALFDPAAEVRNEALKALKERPREEATEILLQGIRYPMAAVARRAAVAVVLLDRRDLLPQLADFLGEAAPGDPVETTGNQPRVCVVREVVRVNHHRNCLLCHSPTSTGSTEEVPGVLPIPGTPFPQSPSDAYGAAKDSNDPMIRADTTYLRQDFSVLLPVENAAPWPEMQRYDFLVRTRVVEGKELAMLQHQMRARPVLERSENHQAALRALRELTGQDAAPTPQAWRQVLGVQAD